MMKKNSTLYNSAFMFTALVFAIATVCIFTSAVSLADQAAKHYRIANPYANVDWMTFGQYKAAYHTHSTNSDGSNTRAAMVEDHYAKGYDILNMADHNFVTTKWDEPGFGRGAGQNNPGIGALSSERRAEIEEGIGRNGKKMIGIPFGNEQSVVHHTVTMWTDFNNTDRGTLTAEQKIVETMRAVEVAGGIAFLAHPGRYTGGQNTNLATGAAASNNSVTVKNYVDIFTMFPKSLIGMEIMNRLDNETRSDRILWDNILMQTMTRGKSVWGFSNDDSHGLNESGFNYNMMLLPELTAEATRQALEAGAFYAVAPVDRRLEVNHVGRNGETMPNGGSATTAYLYTEMKAPRISNIIIKESTITIEGTNYDYIGWVADGVEIARGNSINLHDHSDKVNNYIRAHIVGKGGVAYTQPFGIIVNVPSGASSPLVKSIQRGHAHNDYEHPRPLFDALDNGFCSVEADIFLVNGDLLVAHFPSQTQPERTLKSLYLEPLRERARRLDGKIFPDADVFYLWIDLKTNAQATYAVLRHVLEEYSDILTRYENGTVIPGAITVVLTGSATANLNLVHGEQVRYAGIDGGAAALDSDVPADLIPAIGISWRGAFPQFSGELSSAEREKLTEQVRKGHERGRKLRYWGAPDDENFWRIMYDANVDFINTDRLQPLRKFLVGAETRVSGTPSSAL